MTEEEKQARYDELNRTYNLVTQEDVDIAIPPGDIGERIQLWYELNPDEFAGLDSGDDVLPQRCMGL